MAEVLALVAIIGSLAGCDANRADDLGDQLEGGGSYEKSASDDELNQSVQPGAVPQTGPNAGATISNGISGTGSEAMKSAGDEGVTSDR